MQLHLAVPVVLLALLLAASGVAAVSRGWVLPTNRRQVRRPRLYGTGQLILALALCLQVVPLLVLRHSGIRQLGTLFGNVLLLTGIMVMMASHRTGRDRQGGTL
ncbi:hypothetical protein AMK26_33570 [Streptomyces sp. CB03234]|uniref:hypothetical protein n=1 Tax=Streptomyces sp. (strain CB03234) TaxID=1703937 RepID=UPI000939BB87|nr:hypothetical protein [Streptomyces sp. CB03234]OKJ93436.1 hypothetical protein AMK26_33570 [Streptomyces sp. CB03234]